MAANLRSESPNGYLNLFNSCTGSSLTVLCVKQSRNSCIQFHIFGMKIWYESIGYFGHAAVCMCIGYVHAKMNSHKRGIASLFKIGCDIVQSSDVVSNYTYDILFIISFNWYYMEIRCNIFWFSQFQRLCVCCVSLSWLDHVAHFDAVRNTFAHTTITLSICSNLFLCMFDRKSDMVKWTWTCAAKTGPNIAISSTLPLSLTLQCMFVFEWKRKCHVFVMLDNIRNNGISINGFRFNQFNSSCHG